MRRGVSLLELVVVIAVAGVLAAIALPPARRILDGIAVERAAQAVVAAHRVARFTAIVRGCRTLLLVGADSLMVRSIERTDTLTRWVHPGPAQTAVTLVGPSHSLAFAPTGLPLGVSNATFQFSRGSAVRRVVVSRLGRTRIERQ
jgi:prepilin-type N-terminal cleavage/methylation domain-containing protein